MTAIQFTDAEIDRLADIVSRRIKQRASEAPAAECRQPIERPGQEVWKCGETLLHDRIDRVRDIAVGCSNPELREVARFICDTFLLFSQCGIEGFETDGQAWFQREAPDFEEHTKAPIT